MPRGPNAGVHPGLDPRYSTGQVVTSAVVVVAVSVALVAAVAYPSLVGVAGVGGVAGVLSTR